MKSNTLVLLLIPYSQLVQSNSSSIVSQSSVQAWFLARLSLVVVVAFLAVLSAVAVSRTCFTAYFAIFLVQRYVLDSFGAL